MSQQQQREKTKQERAANIDLRIGLNMLGEHGRALLAEYVKIKLQHRNKKPAA